MTNTIAVNLELVLVLVIGMNRFNDTLPNLGGIESIYKNISSLKLIFSPLCLYTTTTKLLISFKFSIESTYDTIIVSKIYGSSRYLIIYFSEQNHLLKTMAKLIEMRSNFCSAITQTVIYVNQIRIQILTTTTIYLNYFSLFKEAYTIRY